VLNCPFCGKNTLYAFDYSAREDIWFNCTACSGHGNIITLAAQIWNIDLHSAINRLLGSGLTHGGHDEDVVDLVKLSNKQKTAELFWATAVAQTWTHVDDAILHRYREFGISKEIPCEGFVGAAAGQQLADLYSSLNRAWPKGLRPTQPATILPYYDLPGHFSGFLIIQLSRRMETTQVFLPIQFIPTTRPDAGYYMLDSALLPPHDVLKDTLFFVNDPIWVLQAQISQLRHDAPLLPICGTYAGKEAVSYGTSLHNFKNAKKLFSGAELTPDMISQAANAKGYVCVPPAEGLQISTAPLKTIRRLGEIYRAATTWQTAAEAEFKKLEPTAAVTFASKLNVSRTRLQDFLRTRTSLSEIAILEILTKVTQHHSLEMGSLTTSTDVIERDDGWYTPSGLSITTCSPRITKIIYTQNGGKYYEGYVKKQDVVVEFFATAQVVEKIGLLTYAEQLLAAKNILVISSTKWNRRGVNIALKLHPPAVIKISDKLGWDDESREFRFSTYSINNAGEIVPPQCPQLQAAKQFDFPEPSTAAPLDINDFLTASHENAFTWTTVAAVMANFLAPVMGVPQTALAVSRQAYPSVLDIGKTLCCDVYPADKHKVITKVTDNSLMLTVKNKPEANLKYGIVKWLNQPVFMPLSNPGLLAAMSYGWPCLISNEKTSQSVDYSVMRFIAPTYVQRVLRSRIGLSGTGADLIKAILRDMHIWLNATYGQTFNLPAAEACIREPNKAHELFMFELNNAISSGQLDVLPRHRLARQKQNYVIRDDAYWRVNKRVINEYLIKNGIAPDWKSLIDCFANARVFCGEDTINGTRWFLFDKIWCDSFWTDYEEKTAG
jgi:hypothetical protein